MTRPVTWQAVFRRVVLSHAVVAPGAVNEVVEDGWADVTGLCCHPSSGALVAEPLAVGRER